eukprot:TRINITY_DN14015_c0_g1_i2.p1 TRINITY_DN14015_c0_g1~~TRINITY_DN14015_c0_g1_i2.p1  ORF type:complete len:873 (+),score=84.18 TRINITY_DN14015_c0_g1_i2:337-2619(+)
MLWGTYRPGHYLGLKTRQAKSMQMSFSWFVVNTDQIKFPELRELAEDREDIKFGWLRHDGRSFGEQEILDGDLVIHTKWVKSVDRNDNDWAVRVEVQRSEIEDVSAGRLCSIQFTLHDESIELEDVYGTQETWEQIMPTDSVAKKGKLLKGFNTNGIDHFSVWSPGSNTTANVLYYNPEGWKLDQLHSEYLKKAFIMAYQRQIQQEGKKVFDVKEALRFDSNGAIGQHAGNPNTALFQFMQKPPFTIDLVFLSGSKRNELERVASLSGESLTNKFQEAVKFFDAKFNDFMKSSAALKRTKHEEVKEVGKRALSNMLGGMGYFQGSSLVKLQEEVIEEYGPFSLYTAVPCRPKFPRGFLWDEGFHQLLVQQWDPMLSMDAIAHWLDIMSSTGWIPREQILGQEARRRVPAEFVVQEPNFANPPTLMLAIVQLSSMKSTGYKEFFTAAWPRLKSWFQWLDQSQAGKLKGSYKWRGRDPNAIEVNPKTLTSGLDDFPRASHPTDDERHLDLRCWILLMARTLSQIGQLLSLPESEYSLYSNKAANLGSLKNLVDLHYDKERKQFLDWGLHSEDVQVEKIEKEVYNPNTQRPQIMEEMVRHVNEKPVYRYIPHFGYISLFPLILEVFPADSTYLKDTLDQLRNEDLLWTDFGLRSLAKTSSIYMTKNTPNDPPYWRGQIWVNINYLALRALYRYAGTSGPFQTQCQQLYSELRENLLSNIVAQYHSTGFLWEQYSDQNGQGLGGKPFTGWTALVVNIITEHYGS